MKRKILIFHPIMNTIFLMILLFVLFKIWSLNGILQMLIAKLYKTEYNWFIISISLLTLTIVKDLIPIKLIKDNKFTLDIIFTLAISGILIYIMMSLPEMLSRYIILYTLTFLIVNTLLIIVTRQNKPNNSVID